MVEEENRIRFFLTTPFLVAYGFIAALVLMILWGISVFGVINAAAPNASAIEIGRISMSGIAILVNLLLSAGLLVLYLRMTKILSQQRDTMQAAYTPVVTVNDIKVGGHENSNGDCIDLYLSNLGNEVARDLHICYLVHCEPGSETLSIKPTKETLYRPSLPRVASQSSGAVIDVGEKNQRFRARVAFDLLHPDATSGSDSFVNCLKPLREAGVESIYIVLVVIFSNAEGTSYTLPIEPGLMIPLDRDIRSFAEGANVGKACYDVDAILEQTEEPFLENVL